MKRSLNSLSRDNTLSFSERTHRSAKEFSCNQPHSALVTEQMVCTTHRSPDGEIMTAMCTFRPGDGYILSMSWASGALEPEECLDISDVPHG
jgi:hypothetical protein